MPIHPVAQPVAAAAGIAPFPGETPRSLHLSPVLPEGAPGIDGDSGVAVPASRAPAWPGAQTTSRGRSWPLEQLEDVALVLLLVFAVPGVMVLLALPIVVAFRIAAMLGAP